MSQDNIAILNNTLEILKWRRYRVNGRVVKLKLKRKQMEEAAFFPPETIDRLNISGIFQNPGTAGRCCYSCENMDSFSLARIRETETAPLRSLKDKPVLVLNMANPVNPGGGVRRGARAQEEDLCRRSSLLLSLEGRRAASYYESNRFLYSDMGTDAVMIHPRVEVFREADGRLLDETFIVSVMTCAAPYLRYGMEALSMPVQQYQELFYRRIIGMLKTAAFSGYRYLVLGAFGCGAFNNDAHIVSDLFYRALKNFESDGQRQGDVFRRVDFAVLDRSAAQYNYLEFKRNFP